MNTKAVILVFFVTAMLLFISIDAEAQCAMCKAVVESNRDGGGNSVGAGINRGILYMLGFPYVILLIVGTSLIRHFKKYRSINE